MRYRDNPVKHIINGAYSISELSSVARSINLNDLADLLDAGGDMAVQVAAAINEAVGDEEVAPARTPVPAAKTGELSDYEGWTMLADLVPTALADLPKELQEALVAAFRAEAAKAK